MDGYIINYLYLLAQFLEQIIAANPLVKSDLPSGRSWMTVCSVIFGEYMGKGIDHSGGDRGMKYYLLNWEETGKSGAEDPKLDGETGLSGSSKKRIGEVTGANHSFFGRKFRIHCFLM